MMRLGYWFLVACFFEGDPLGAQPAFFRKDIPVAERLSTVVIGDFNGDSRPDMAVVSTGGTSVLLNHGHGSFGRPIRLDSMFSAQLAADFDGDGKLDLVGGADSPFPAIFIVLGRGDGTFLPPRELARGYNRGFEGDFKAVAGDFNGDGKPDLVVYSLAGALGSAKQ